MEPYRGKNCPATILGFATSYIDHRASNTEHRASKIEHRTLNIEFWTSATIFYLSIIASLAHTLRSASRWIKQPRDGEALQTLPSADHHLANTAITVVQLLFSSYSGVYCQFRRIFWYTSYPIIISRSYGRKALRTSEFILLLFFLASMGAIIPSVVIILASDLAFNTWNCLFP